MDHQESTKIAPISSNDYDDGNLSDQMFYVAKPSPSIAPEPSAQLADDYGYGKEEPKPMSSSLIGDPA